MKSDRVALNHPDETEYASIRLSEYDKGVALELCERDRDGIVAIALLQRHEAHELVRKLTGVLTDTPQESP